MATTTTTTSFAGPGVEDSLQYGDINYSIIVEMKDWLLDCCYDDDDVEYVQEATQYEICDLVERNYEGGVKAFIASIHGS